jgi:hypothetical protein
MGMSLPDPSLRVTSTGENIRLACEPDEEHDLTSPLFSWCLSPSINPRQQPPRTHEVGVVLGAEVFAQQPLLGPDPRH